MILLCEKLSASYGSKKVLNNISISINQGDFVCLCGPNGSGKSTLLKILCGVEKGSSSKLKITGDTGFPIIKDEKFISLLKDKNQQYIAQNISYLEQSEFFAWNTTVFNMILTGRFAFSKIAYSKNDYEIVYETASYLGIDNLLERDIQSLSGGEFQKCRIARSIVQSPKFLLLDEPTANLDILFETELLQKLKDIAKNKNIGILISIHNINAASRFAQKIALLTKSGLIFGTPSQIITQENIDLTYGEGLNIYMHPIWNCKQIC